MNTQRIDLGGALVVATAALAACAGSSRQQIAPQAGGAGPVIYVSSARPQNDIARCLTRRMPDARIAQRSGTTTVLIGPHRATADWTVSLLPNSTSRTTIAVYPPQHDSGDPPESDVRFNLARCTV